MLLNKQKNVQRTTLNIQFRSQIRHALLHESEPYRMLIEPK